MPVKTLTLRITSYNVCYTKLLRNPPYGERMMDKDEAKRLYLIMRRVFSPHPGWSVNVFTGMREFEQVYGARADKRRKLTNGGMPCTLYQYFGKRDV